MTSTSLLPGSIPDEMFPVLTATQQTRRLAHRRTQQIAAHEILVDFNQQPTKFFVVVKGNLEIFRVNE